MARSAAYQGNGAAGTPALTDGEDEDDRGLWLLGQYGWADEDVSEAGQQVGVGLVLFEICDRDELASATAGVGGTAGPSTRRQSCTSPCTARGSLRGMVACPAEP